MQWRSSGEIHYFKGKINYFKISLFNKLFSYTFTPSNKNKMKNEYYLIKKSNTESEYFSLLGSPHFTENIEIAQRFSSIEDAENCTEQYIDSDEGYEMFGMIFTEIV